MKTTQILIYSIFLFLISCGDSVSDMDHLLYQDSKDGLLKHTTVGDYIYSLRYIPTEELAKKELGEPLNESNYNDAIDPFLDHQYLRLTISNGNYGKILDGLEEEKLNKIRFHLGKNFSISVNGQESIASLYHFEPPVISYRGINFMMVFPDLGYVPDRLFSEDLSFQFLDEVFSNQTIKLKFNKQDLNNIPSIKL